MESKVKNVIGFTLIESRFVNELNGIMSILEHEVTKAKVCVIENDDENKVFSIGFRTPPKDSTGVAHILEHSVLCGSDKYPLKEPFVELVKGSLCNFINAMTYPDKTIYPIASTNLQDFKNASNVYADAVFHPLIYTKPEIFKQEGWHYEINDANELTINGVVYNEMKGVFSNPEDCILEYVMESLFPDTSYGFVSGGKPEDIPNLSYEQFLEFHSTYYHPSNSYIYIYGNCDMEERLNWLHNEILAGYAYKKVDSQIKNQSAFKQLRTTNYNYSIEENDTLNDKSFLSLNYALNLPKDCAHLFAFKVLSYLLIDSNAALLKKALINAEIGKEIMGGFQDGIHQPIFLIISKYANDNQLELFKQVINETLKDIVSKGLNKQDCLAALNAIQFSTIETTSLPKGLDNNIALLDSWLYNQNPYAFIQYQESFDTVRQWIEQGKLEQLIQKYLIDNTFGCYLILSPKVNYQKEKDIQLSNYLLEVKNKLTENQFNQIKQDEIDLKNYQLSNDDKLTLKKLPSLKRKDLSKNGIDYLCDDYTIDNIRIIGSTISSCNGIVYLNQYFDLSKLSNQQLPFVALLIKLLGKLDTTLYSYEALDTQILTVSGGCSYRFDCFNVDDTFAPYTYLSIKVMNDKVLDGLQLMQHIATQTLFNNVDRIKVCINEMLSSMQSELMGNSHMAVYQRMVSYLQMTSAFMEAVGGFDFYNFLKDLANAFNHNKKELINHTLEQLKSIQKNLFTMDSLMVNYTCKQEDVESVNYAIQQFVETSAYANHSKFDGELSFELEVKNEAYTTSGMVNYVGLATLLEPSKFNIGTLSVLKNVLNYDYLWNNVRVDGGAYGVFNIINRKGLFAFVSYRDPQIKKTYDTYLNVANAIKDLDLNDNSLLKNIIGTIGGMDSPVGAKEYGTLALRYYLNGISMKMLQQDRHAILNCQLDDLKELSTLIEIALKNAVVCTIGAKNLIEDNASYYQQIKPLV